MSKTVTISDDLAALVEARWRAQGFATIDAAAEALITHGLIAAADGVIILWGAATKSFAFLSTKRTRAVRPSRGTPRRQRPRCSAGTRPYGAGNAPVRILRRPKFVDDLTEAYAYLADRNADRRIDPQDPLEASQTGNPVEQGGHGFHLAVTFHDRRHVPHDYSPFRPN